MDKAQRKLVDSLVKKAQRKRVKLYDTDLPVPNAQDGYVASRDDGKHTQKNGLSKIEERFVHKYTTHYNRSRAVIEAGYQPSRAHQYAHDLLTAPRIKDAIDEIERDRLRRMRIDGDFVLAKIVQLAFANPNDLVEMWIPPCRYCWGRNHEYQRTHGEFQEDWDAYCKGAKKVPFDEKGGADYDENQSPNSDCPNCHGRGLHRDPVVHFKDSRFLTPDAKALYSGAEVTKNGIKVLQRDQSAALGFLQRWAEKLLELRQEKDQRTIELTIPNVESGSKLKIERIERIIIEPPAVEEKLINGRDGSSGEDC